MTIDFDDLMEESNLMLVDALNLAFRYKISNKASFTDSYITTIQSLANSYKAKRVVVCCDSGSSSYRKALLPEYKLQRKEKFDQQTDEEKEEFEVFFEEFNNAVRMMETMKSMAVLRFDKCEADDIAAYIVNKYSKYFPHTWLMSSDKDWDLLVNPKVSRFSYVTRKEITYDNWKEHYEYDVEDHISIKCLTGDSGDNIPGVPGIGPKKAMALVKEFGSTYDIIASLPIQSKYKHIQALNEFGKDRLLLNYKLMDLVSYSEDALGIDNCAVIDKTLESYFS